MHGCKSPCGHPHPGVIVILGLDKLYVRIIIYHVIVYVPSNSSNVSTRAYVELNQTSLIISVIIKSKLPISTITFLPLILCVNVMQDIITFFELWVGASQMDH